MVFGSTNTVNYHFKKDTNTTTTETQPYLAVDKVKIQNEDTRTEPLPVKEKIYEQPLKSSVSAIHERMFRIYNVVAGAL